VVLVRSVEYLEDFRVLLEFSDGTRRTVDLEPLLHGPIFAPLRDRECFRRVHVDEELGTIVWDNGADMDPDVLYGSALPAWQIDDEPRVA
jgi:hypothetical protein